MSSADTLANELLGAALRNEDIPCRGITALTPDDIAKAAGIGCKWKLIGSAQRHADGTVTAEVCPRMVPETTALASVPGATNSILFRTAMLGEVIVTGPGAGCIETAYALLSDIIAIDRAQCAVAREVA